MKKELVDQMTLQEACDFAVLKIVEQGGRCMSVHNKGICSYSNGQGWHCAVGWLLDETNENMMNTSAVIGYLSSYYPDSVPNLIKDNLEVFMRLQMFHDNTLKDDRKEDIALLQDFGIDTSKPQWDQWVEMGKDSSKD